MSHPYHGLNELREMFLKFFETKGHLRLPSFSLVPQNGFLCFPFWHLLDLLAIF